LHDTGERRAMLTLRNVPNLRDANVWEHPSGDGGDSANVIRWPADDGNKLVLVRVGVMALGDYDAYGLGINSAEVEDALTRHRDLIQQLAQAKYRAGDEQVTLDVGDFPSPLLPRLPIPKSGQTRISPASGKEFIVECSQFDKPDHYRLMGFFNQMHGRAGAFRFEFGTTGYPRCYFCSDGLTMEQTSRHVFRVRFPIEVVASK
jgi:hypothetical protein